jgi:hypothetical protein
MVRHPTLAVRESDEGSPAIRLPDFIIGGAMKSGTTSLHHILNRHERVFIPDPEIGFYDIDDIEQHPDYFVKTRQGWSCFDYDAHWDEYLAWYASFFRDARKGQSIGEDSTSYLASEKAPGRIADLVPDVKLIFMLRDPVARTYSHYWHMVRSRRAIFDFDSALQYTPGNLIRRSMYRIQIERYKAHFDPRQMKLVLFEAFLEDRQSIVDDVCRFLDLGGGIDIAAAPGHRNPALVPASVRLQLIQNRLFRRLAARRYVDSHLPGAPPRPANRILSVLEWAFRRMNPVREGRYPPMSPDTKAFLQELFARENAGISELIGTDVRRYWPYMREG